MHKPWMIALLGAVAVAGSAGAMQPVVTESGALSGVIEKGVAVYKGVPFAAAPLRNLRWRAPEPVMSWDGTRAATTFAPACMQEGVSMPGETPPTVSEDCLYLNIWTPGAKVGKKLPVIVWIHGGGYRNGSASMPLYWGDRLARNGVIVVTIAYRLGPLGFLALPDLTRESPNASSGNYGLMDQIAALEWIHRNIAQFGGDPERVTIAGQSSGSISVSILMASPRARGLFQRAIGESGGLFEPLQLAPSYLLVNAEHDGERYVAALGAKSLEELRQLPATALLGGANAGGITHPVIEPYLLPESPYEAFASGDQTDVPLLIGSNQEEARSLSDVTHTSASTFDADIRNTFGELPPAILAAYPHADDAAARASRLDLERDLRFGWDMWAWARLQAKTGHSPVYYYVFTQRPPFPADSVYQEWGASHFAELWYVFDHLNQDRWNWRVADYKLANRISRYWVNFARAGDPNGWRLPQWPAFTNSKGRVLALGEPIAVGKVANLASLTVLDAVYTGVRGKPFLVSAQSAVPIATDPAATYDARQWLDDLNQARQALATKYANLEWAVFERETNLAALFSETKQRIEAASNASEARAAMDRLARKLGDGHVEFQWRAPQDSTQPRTADCAVLGYNARMFGTPVAALVPGYVPLRSPAAAEFPTGTIQVGAYKIGVIKIGIFTPQGIPELCSAALEVLRIPPATPCDEACSDRIEAWASDRMTADFAIQLRALKATGAKLILVDVANNGGGTEWAEAAARIVTAVRLKSERFGFVRGVHWANAFEKKEAVLRAAAAEAEDQDRAFLLALADEVAVRRHEAETPCDSTPFWRGERPICRWLGDGLFATGLLESDSVQVHGKPWASQVFTPAKFNYPEGVWRGPLIVLVNGSTGSAAEEFTAVLQDNHAAVVMGAPTVGAGCGHTDGGTPTTLNYSRGVFAVPDCARFRADGSNEVMGVQPDVLVGLRAEDGPHRQGVRVAARLQEAVERALRLKSIGVAVVR